MIDKFEGKYDFLSNFYPVMVWFDGRGYKTVEHAYQAAKSDDPAYRKRIQGCYSPTAAKKVGKKAKLRDDWEQQKVKVMAVLLEQKFKDEQLRDLLLETIPEKLVEGNWWGDTFWGVCNGEGKNWLGKLLMELRTTLEKERNKWQLSQSTSTGPSLTETTSPSKEQKTPSASSESTDTKSSSTRATARSSSKKS